MLESGVAGLPEYFNFASDVLDRWAHERPEALGLWCVNAQGETQARYTFRQLARLSCQAAYWLRSIGLGRGSRVLIMLPRIPQWWIAMLGLIRLGAVPVPSTLQFSARDVGFRLRTARVETVITTVEGMDKVAGFEGRCILVGGNQEGWLDFEAGVNQASDHFESEPIPSEAPGLLYFTSATTGDPKMVLHTQSSYGLGHRLTGQWWLDLQPNDLHWNISDPGWGKAAWSSLYGPWHLGACVFVREMPGKFEPRLALDTLAEFPITTWCVPPTALRLIVRQNLARRRFPHLRHCVTAGEPLNPEVFSAWKSATGLTLYEAYGQTETVVLIGNFRSLNLPVRPGSMGVATPGFHLGVLDENLDPAPAGTEGEIALRVQPQRPLGLFQEYWLNPEETARRMQGDWYLTGDRAIRDQDGYFWFVGRQDDIIKSSGYRIGPFEVESLLMEHPAVLEAAVVAKPDEMRGQIVKAFVVLRENVQAHDPLRLELQQHCKQLAAPYKYPREIEFVRELPKTVSGKTRRFELRQRG